MKNELLSAGVAAQRLGVSRRRVLQLIAAGRFPNAFQLVGTADNMIWLIPSKDLERADVKERKPGRPATKKAKK